MPMKVRYDKKALYRIRLRQGLTQEEAARRTGMSRQNFAYLERGLTEPRAKTLARLATALGLPVAEFFVSRESYQSDKETA